MKVEWSEMREGPVRHAAGEIMQARVCRVLWTREQTLASILSEAESCGRVLARGVT